VPARQFQEPAVRGNPRVRARIERHGGHCGFVGEPSDGGDGYWAEAAAVRFLAPFMEA